MAKSINDIEKRRRGRPATDATPVLVRMMPAAIEALDSWIARQPNPQPTRPDAIRKLIDYALVDGGPKILSVEQKIARAKRKIAKNPIPKAPSPEKGMAMLRRGKAEAGLAAFKTKARKPK
jgi:hypothetical protein